MRNKVGEILIQHGVIAEKDLQLARFEQKRSGGRLGAILVRLNMATEAKILEALSEQFNISCIDLTQTPPDRQAVAMVPKHFALKHNCIAYKLDGGTLQVVVSDPLSLTVVHDLEFATGYRIQLYLAPSAQILAAIEKYYSNIALDLAGENRADDELTTSSSPSNLASQQPSTGQKKSDAQEYFKTSSESETETSDSSGPIAKLLDGILDEALIAKASDVHIEPTETGVTVRHRLDGLLKVVAIVPKWAQEGLITRLKVMASLDIAEKRLPQDARLQVRSSDGRLVDFRISTLKTLHGEKVVLRILDHSKGITSLESLGLSNSNLQSFRQFLKHQHGMILAVGPTGSGKSTTLASALSSLKSVTTNIITIEDPIEYEIPGVNQTQIHDKIKLTFARSLRSILRQDPDVIFLGEIRDHETAQIAMQAAQTGHLVLSTLHTDDAPSVVTRLTDMGIEPYIIGSALLGVVAQRLVRKLCPKCRTQYVPQPEVLQALNISADQASLWPLYRPVGCSECRNTGYQGRIGIFEVMNITNRMSRMISQRADENAIRDAAQEAGMTTLGDDGLAKVNAGITSAEELLRVVTDVHEMRTFCPACGCVVGVDFAACPECGQRLGGGCPKCGRLLKPSWDFCPYCTTRISQNAVRPASKASRTIIDAFRETSVR